MKKTLYIILSIALLLLSSCFKDTENSDNTETQINKNGWGFDSATEIEWVADTKGTIDSGSIKSWLDIN